MKIRNKQTGIIFHLPAEEAKRLMEESIELFELVDVTQADLKKFNEIKIPKPLTFETKITGEIDFENLEWNKLVALAKEYGINVKGKKKEVLIKEMKEHAK